MLSTKLKEAAGNSADATLYVDDVFSTWLYTGNGSTQTITNGIDLAGKGGLVWAKQRSSTENHYLFDTVRGVNRYLKSSNTDSQTTVTATLPAFNSNGFDVGGNGPNTNATTYASWTFREAAKFFDVVTYTGANAAQTIPHNLGSTPGCVIIKCTNVGGTSWWVRHRSVPGNAALLNSTAPFGFNINDLPAVSSTALSFPSGGQATNQSSETYVAYLFAHDAGGFGATGTDNVISCGSYTEGSAPVSVSLGYEPQWLLIKSSSISANWHLFDVMRGMSNTQQSYLYPNLNNAEGSQAAYFIPTATGFTAVNDYFGSGTSVIYIAIRMPNKPPTTGTQVFSPNYFASGTSSPIVTNFPVDMQLYAYPPGASSINTAVVDRLRGVSTTTTTGGPRLITSDTAAESAAASSLGWSNIGFSKSPSFGSSDAQLYLNFKRAPGFMDVVCYTSSSGAPEAHNLGVAPQLIISKCRNLTGQNWFVNAPSLMTTYGKLNLVDAWAGDATPYSATATTFNPISYGSTKNMVSYLFATLAGISKVGSYTGNGTGQAIACGFGAAGARFVLIKRTDAAGDWYTFDSARGLTSGSSPYLLLNSTAAEVTGNNGVYASTGGFTLGATAITKTNIATATYIFLAVA